MSVSEAEREREYWHNRFSYETTDTLERAYFEARSTFGILSHIGFMTLCYELTRRGVDIEKSYIVYIIKAEIFNVSHVPSYYTYYRAKVIL